MPENIDVKNLDPVVLINAMKGLKANIGWQYLCQFLTDSKITSLRLRLDGKDEENPIKDIEELKRLQFELGVMETLVNYPDVLIAGVAETPEDEDQEEDPYIDVDELKEEMDNNSDKTS